MIRDKAVACLVVQASQTGYTSGILLAVLNDKAKVNRKALVGEGSMASGPGGVMQSLVEFIVNTDRTMVKRITIRETGKTLDVMVKLGGLLEANMAKSMMPQYLEVHMGEGGKISIYSGGSAQPSSR